jgi:hypothetical protein
MAEGSQDTHPDELRSDLDVMIEMANDLKKNGEFIERHVESLKTKLDKFIHEKRTHGGDGSAS